MALNIKNERTVDAVKRLAARYDVSYTRAIEVAVEAALQAPDRQAQERSLERVSRLAADYRSHLPADAGPEIDDLYDGQGLYR
ncbi:MAG: type II toxin-antitoxin system VapB family antitoxin [Propionicimonas sp.]|uniref:type II toxin-antitoxin system VapB family antitoxin n=1 Tax=Propionicimonas sp. TaxID=1955623 RepID=UPI002B205F90|nr:type II toxin-antitoxin system VapB family antitoxin [Propionicimonas sp.]MEA4944673.1 type II toxin-antitoxin system VapB family antitoxin [Propionicimonas sp.]MEA5117852.1 type II toxin-antitoxin system VapB family antitoxin [Propionicimonas sp.]